MPLSLRCLFAFPQGRIHVLLCLLLTWFALPTAHAQSPKWQTVLAASQEPGNSSEVHATAPDDQGNIFVVGGLIGTVSFGNTTLTSAGSQDIFVAKWSSASNSFIWAIRAGGTDIDYVNSVAVQASSIYLSGYVGIAPATFGRFTLDNADQGRDVFVAKVTDAGSSGSFTWVQQGKGNFNSATAVAVQGTNVYLVGAFVSTATFGSYTLHAAVSTAYELFVAKLTDAGSSASFGWVQQAGGLASTEGVQAEAYTVALNGSAIYVGGNFRGTVYFGAHALSAVGYYDGFVTKLLDTGAQADFVWAQGIGGIEDDEVNALAANGATVYVAGSFRGTAGLGTMTLANADLSGRTTDAFVAKLLDEGPTARFGWSQPIGGTGYDEATALAVQQQAVYVAGSFQGSTTGVGSSTLQSSGSYDGFIAKLLDAGTTSTFHWAERLGGTSYDRADAVSVTGMNVVVGGYASPPAQFGALTLATPTGTGTAFLASLTEKPLPVVLTSFTVVRQGATARLRWATAQELHNERFEVEASTNGVQFRVLGQVPGHGTSSQGYEYTFTDPQLDAHGIATVYYRLRQVDDTGGATYSAVQAITTADSPFLVHAYPVPFGPSLRVQVTLPAAGLTTLHLHDLRGQTLYQLHVTLPVGRSEVVFPAVGHLPPGLYLLTVQQGTWQQHVKLVHE
jgi:hypothetical protein